MADQSKRSVFITGAAGGLGKASAALLVEKGWQVIVADFDRARLRATAKELDCAAVEIDVTNAESVAKAARSVRRRVEGLDGVVNFAGVLTIGSMIEMPESALRRIFDVNVFGTFLVNQAFFPLVQARSGRIVNISSETGWQSGAPFNGAYAMTKHAIEAYSDSLRRELALLGIHVIKIQPGPFKTEMTSSIAPNFERAAAASTLFGDVIRRMSGAAASEGEHANDPKILANVVFKALTVKRPHPAYSVRPGQARVMMEKLPVAVADELLKQVMKRL